MNKNKTKTMPEYPRLRVTAVIRDGDKYLLIEESIKSENDEFFWLFPGGGVEPFETLEGAILREVREETGLNCKIIKPLEFSERYRPEIFFHTLNFYFLLERVSGELISEQKAKNIGWFTKEEALNLNILSPEKNKNILTKYL